MQVCEWRARPHRARNIARKSPMMPCGFPDFPRFRQNAKWIYVRGNLVLRLLLLFSFYRLGFRIMSQRQTVMQCGICFSSRTKLHRRHLGLYMIKAAPSVMIQQLNVNAIALKCLLALAENKLLLRTLELQT